MIIQWHQCEFFQMKSVIDLVTFIVILFIMPKRQGKVLWSHPQLRLYINSWWLFCLPGNKKEQKGGEKKMNLLFPQGLVNFLRQWVLLTSPAQVGSPVTSTCFAVQTSCTRCRFLRLPGCTKRQWICSAGQRVLDQKIYILHINPSLFKLTRQGIIFPSFTR